MDCCLRITPFLLIVAISGAFSASLLPSPQSQALVRPQRETKNTDKTAFLLEIRIKNREFTDALNDHNSQAYKNLRAEVTEVLNKAYACNSCPTKDFYQGVAEMTFRKGSVIADSVLLFDMTMINEVVVKFLFLQSAGSNDTAGLEIDKDFITDSQIAVPVTSATTTQPSTTSQVLSTHTTHLTQSTTAHYLSSSVSKFTTTSTKSTTSLPLSHVTNGTKGSTTTTSHTSSETSTSVSTSLKSTADFTNNTTSLPVTTRTSVSTATTPKNDTSKKSSSPLRYTTKGPASKSASSGHNGSTSTSTRPPVNYSTSLPNSRKSTQTQHTSGLTALKRSTAAPHPPNVITSGRPEGHSTVHVTASTRRPSSDSHSPVVTQPNREPRMTTSSSSAGGGVPGWAIALLVLACVILLLVIVVLILVLWRWCCHREEPGFVYVSGEPNPYGKAKQVPPGPEVMAKEPSFKNLDDAEKPKRSRSGFYVVNPE